MGTLTAFANRFIKEKKKPIKNSYWRSSSEITGFDELIENIETDVVVVGGGITGISTAFLLSKAGKRVTVIESHNLGNGETGHTTSQLVTILGSGYYNLDNSRGENVSKLVAQSHTFAIDTIESIIKDYNIECDFCRTDGYLFSDDKEKYHSLINESKSCAKAGLPIELVKQIPGVNGNLLGIKIQGQAKFHPIKYIKALSQLIIENGGKIFINSPIVNVNSFGVETRKGFKVKAAHIVVATHFPINFPKKFRLKLKTNRTYVIAAKIPKNSLPDILWWEFNNEIPNRTVGHYVRIEKNYDIDHDLLFIGGEDHQNDFEQKIIVDHFKKLKEWGNSHFPMMGEIVYRWSGKVFESVDALAMIGRNPFDSGNIYIGTADSGSIMTYSTIAGLIFRDLIKGKKNPWEELYDPGRIISEKPDVMIKNTLSSLKDFNKEMTSGDVESYKETEKGEYLVMKYNNQKVAIYKGFDGTITTKPIKNKNEEALFLQEEISHK